MRDPWVNQRVRRRLRVLLAGARGTVVRPPPRPREVRRCQAPLAAAAPAEDWPVPPSVCERGRPSVADAIRRRVALRACTVSLQVGGGRRRDAPQARSPVLRCRVRRREVLCARVVPSSDRSRRTRGSLLFRVGGLRPAAAATQPLGGPVLRRVDAMNWRIRSIRTDLDPLVLSCFVVEILRLLLSSPPFRSFQRVTLDSRLHRKLLARVVETQG